VKAGLAAFGRKSRRWGLEVLGSSILAIKPNAGNPPGALEAEDTGEGLFPRKADEAIYAPAQFGRRAGARESNENEFDIYRDRG